MIRSTAGAFVLAVSLLVAASANAGAPPVGPLPKGPVTTIATSKGQLVSIALPSRGSLSWRLAQPVSPKVLVEVSEANVGKSVVVVYRATGPGSVSVRYGLTRGETRKAYASATFEVTIK
jgi:hypothetical protein